MGNNIHLRIFDHTVQEDVLHQFPKCDVIPREGEYVWVNDECYEVMEIAYSIDEGQTMVDLNVIDAEGF
jgi:hypothetical protein